MILPRHSDTYIDSVVRTPNQERSLWMLQVTFIWLILVRPLGRVANHCPELSQSCTSRSVSAPLNGNMLTLTLSTCFQLVIYACEMVTDPASSSYQSQRLD